MTRAPLREAVLGGQPLRFFQQLAPKPRAIDRGEVNALPHPPRQSIAVDSSWVVVEGVTRYASRSKPAAPSIGGRTTFASIALSAVGLPVLTACADAALFSSCGTLRQVSFRPLTPAIWSRNARCVRPLPSRNGCM